MYCLYKVALLREQQSRHNVPLMGRESYPCICTQKSRTQIFQKYKGYLPFTRQGVRGRCKSVSTVSRYFFFLMFNITDAYMVLFSPVKAAVYYTRNKVPVLECVPLAKAGICRLWAHHPLCSLRS